MALNPEISKIARQQIGLYLRDIRGHKQISKYKMAQLTGMTRRQIMDIEKGETNYSIDSFLAYIQAVDCYFYLADKEGKHLDSDHMIKKSDDPA